MNALPKNDALVADRFDALNEFVPLRSISSPEDYEAAVTTLNQLLDRGAAAQDHVLAPVAAVLGDLIAVWEDAHVAVPEGSPAEVLRFLMREHGLRQSDLPEIGSQGVVSQILSGSRQLNVSHIVGLSARFGVDPAVFLPTR